MTERHVKIPLEVEGAQWAGGEDDAERVIAWLEAHGGTGEYLPERPFDEESQRVGRDELMHIDTPLGVIVLIPTGYVGWSEVEGFYTRTAEAWERTYDDGSAAAAFTG